MSDLTHLSIGEVLALLQEDFPDVTISKIRFLESQGLIDPERTPSGYRKFHDEDVDRLRWILRQQREHFLPLKVIKDRLASGDVDLDEAPAVAAGRGDGASDPSAAVAMLQEAPAPAPASSRSRGRGTSRRRPGTGGGATRDEVLAETGLSARQLGELERYGVVVPTPSAGATVYDAEARHVASLAAAFLRHGVEARHLRMYLVAAQREAGVFEQLVAPVAHKRGARAQARSSELVAELLELGAGMRDAMLRRLLRDELES